MLRWQLLLRSKRLLILWRLNLHILQLNLLLILKCCRPTGHREVDLVSVLRNLLPCKLLVDENGPRPTTLHGLYDLRFFVLHVQGHGMRLRGLGNFGGLLLACHLDALRVRSLQIGKQIDFTLAVDSRLLELGLEAKGRVVVLGGVLVNGGEQGVALVHVLHKLLMGHCGRVLVVAVEELRRVLVLKCVAGCYVWVEGQLRFEDCNLVKTAAVFELEGMLIVFFAEYVVNLWSFAVAGCDCL